MTRKTLKEKLDNASAPNNPHIEEAPAMWFGGRLGGKMVIPSAWDLDTIIRTIPEGKTRNIKDIRNEYAKNHGADITCPMTTGIFLRMLADYSEEQRVEGVKKITPYWRVVADNGKMPPKVQAIFDAHHDEPLP